MILFAGRIEVAGRKRMLIIGQRGEQFGELLVGCNTHFGRVIRRRKMYAETGQQGAVWQDEGRLQHAANIADSFRKFRQFERM